MGSVVTGAVGVSVLLVVVAVLFGLKIKFTPEVSSVWIPGENYFEDPLSQTRHSFPALVAGSGRSSHSSPSSVYLSVIVPAYNEQKRLPAMLNETIAYLHHRATVDPSFTYEIIIVDDGSKDSTTMCAQSYLLPQGSPDCDKNPELPLLTTENFRVLKLLKNRGKGGAVKRGMLCARGQLLLMVDADGATKFSDLESLEKQLQPFVSSHTAGLAIGSRAHMQTETEVQRTFIRMILQKGFHAFVTVMCSYAGHIKDTQCGFKLFTREAAALLFPNQHIERWAFDIELIYLASKQGVKLFEVPVNWHEIDGSKLTPFASSVQMARDLLRIRLMYLFGLWSIQ
ncbi:Dolichylphosphate beta-glucosyltransferase [Pelomyxa schiedti]|nr:Dolichylphosphate beta-glucosyltransferase [Pelomyxa schiedti]